MPVSYDYYRIFYYVAKYRNLTQAAAVLFMSQPNVSRVMRQLENELGCRLLIRSNTGVALTKEGEQLFARVSVAFEQLAAGEAELSQSVELQRGSVAIGASETALHLLVLDKLREFHTRYPNVRLHIFNYNTPQALAALRSGQIDCAVVTTPTEAPTGLQEVPLMRFEEILVAGKRFAGFAQQPRELGELASYSLICLARPTSTFAMLNRFYLEHGLVLEPDIEVATADLILPMVKNNLGLGFLPQEFAVRALERGEIVQIQLKERLPQRKVCMVYDPKRIFGVAAQRLMTLLQENVKEMAE